MSRTIHTANDDGRTEPSELQTERHTASVHRALSASLLHGWEMDRQDMTYITLTHDSGKQVDVIYNPADREWIVESDEFCQTAVESDVAQLAQDEMFRIGR